MTDVPVDTEQSLLRGLRNGAWLDTQQFPPLRYAVPPLVPEGFTLNIGAPKIGKSWEVLDFALAISAGGVALGKLRVGEPRPVLVLALEDGDRRMQDRCRKLLDGAPIPAGFQYMTRIDHGRILDTIVEWLDEYGTEEPAVFVDTLGKVMPPTGLGESAYQRDYRVGAALKRLADDHPGSSVFVNHHDRKASSDDFVDSVSGTHGLAGAADTILVLCRNRNETDGLIKITGRDVPENEYALKLERGMFWTLAGDDLEASSRRAGELRARNGLGDRSLDVLTLVNEHPDGITVKAVDDELGITDGRTYLGRLADTNRIVRLRRGTYAPYPTRVASVASVGGLQHRNGSTAHA